MPNWIQNIVHFDCEEQQFKEICKKIVNKNEFDFNRIIKMPRSIKKEMKAGMNDRDAITCYLTSENRDREAKNIAAGYYSASFPEDSDFKNYQTDLLKDLKTRTQEQIKAICEKGKTLYNNINNYGATDWYDWSIKYWGTKWNASETQIDEKGQDIYFQTPWSAPMPILIEASKMFPEITITAKFADEDIGGGNNGLLELKEGKVISESYDLGDEFAAVEVWGYESVEGYYGYDSDEEGDEGSEEENKENEEETTKEEE